MSGVSVLTLARGREGHLSQMVEGLRRSRQAPAELIVVDMNPNPIAGLAADFPIHVERLATEGLPLAAARNRAAARASSDVLVFLDVDCIPMADCLGRLCAEAERHEGLLCADVRYLGPEDARGAWTERELMLAGHSHPVRAFPRSGMRREPNPGLFWSLAFAVRRKTFDQLGGFDEEFTGYGAEDTDLGYRADANGVPLLFVGGAIACHQHHQSQDPPIQHLHDIVRNARRFHDKWSRWPMEGWLKAFAERGLVEWDGGTLQLTHSAHTICGVTTT